MKPIEPGCLAVIVGGVFPQAIGRLVEVQRFHPILGEWEFAPAFRESIIFSPEKYLLRIDDHDPDEADRAVKNTQVNGA